VKRFRKSGYKAKSKGYCFSRRRNPRLKKPFESYKLSPLATAAFFMENGKEEKAMNV
jgi:hypothetical protein